MAALILGAAHAPASMWATQSAMISRGYRLWFLFVAYLLGLSLLVAMLRRIGLGFRIALYSGSLIGLVGGYGARIVESGILLAVLCVVIVLVLQVSRRFRVLDHLMLVLVVVLGLGPPAQWFSEYIGRTPSDLQTPISLGHADGWSMRPDVWVLVLDGYPSDWALRSVFGSMGETLSNRLRAEGFDVNPNALVPYPWTVVAVPSVLSGDPIAPTGTRIGPKEMEHVKGLLGGLAPAFQTMTDRGYELNVVESGWHLSRCVAEVDRCVPSPFYDEATSTLFRQSAFSRVKALNPGSSFALGARHTFDTALGLRATFSDSDAPQMTFLHSLAPHPPLALDDKCKLHTPEASLGGGVLGDVSFSEQLIAERAEAFLEQVSCVDDLVAGLIEQLPPDDVLVVFGDHGSDMLGQSGLHPDDWTDEMFFERHLSLAALRLPGCSADPVSTLDLIPAVIACLEGEAPPPSDPVTFSLPNIKQDGETLPVQEVQEPTLHGLLRIARGS